MTTISSFVVSGMMVIQYFFGIVNTNIKGLITTMGQDIETKNIGYGLSGAGAEANKMPSTYQNGNAAGIFLALALTALLVWRPVDKKWGKLKVAG
ncbi:MAG: hypothetical protein LBD38_02530, partial [Streptococcaceae bacterium]|nr:hypothetical protein [Streptococcaceae bacterium]